MRPHLCYIAGPFTSEQPEQVSLNVQRAEEAGLAILRKGHYVVIPHTMTAGLDGLLPYETFMDLSLELVRRCDWLLFLGHSPGADRELALAETRGMAVFYSVEEVPEVG